MQSAVTQLIDRFKKWRGDPLSNWHQLQSDPLQAVRSHPLAPEARSQGLTVKDVGTLNHYTQDELPPSKGLEEAKKGTLELSSSSDVTGLWGCDVIRLHKCGSGVTCIDAHVYATIQSGVKACISPADWLSKPLATLCFVLSLCANCMNVKYQQGQ